MKSAQLRMAEEELGISKSEAKALKKMNLRERLARGIERYSVLLISGLAAMLGLSVQLYYSYKENQSYPGGSYERPSWGLPILVFGSVAGVSGLVAAGYVKKRKPQSVEKQLSLIFLTVVAAIFAFITAYLLGQFIYDAHCYMYGVYSREVEHGG